jgi:hypothetical protein
VSNLSRELRLWRGIFGKFIFLTRRIDEIFNNGLRETRELLWLRSVLARGQGRMGRLETRDLANNRHPRSDGASQKKHLGMTTLLCGATF